jgi:RNA polymerase sigma factor (sigma-70 family)
MGGGRSKNATEMALAFLLPARYIGDGVTIATGALRMEANQSDLLQLGTLHQRLVHLCARLVGDPDAAEDLAQETLAEAWRLRQRLRDDTLDFPWLAAIARNLCLRWRRRQGRERAHAHFASVGLDDGEDGLLDRLPDPEDFTVELERHELATLLDRALALLPPATARLLIARYVEESPHAAIAARLGISPDAVGMRLARGKLQLRRLLDTELRDEAASYGLDLPAAGGWRETRVWCPKCGRRRLDGRFERPVGFLAFRCPDCQPAPDALLVAYRLGNPGFARLLAGVDSFKPAYTRTLVWLHDYYRRGLNGGEVACTSCGRPIPLIRATGACDEAPFGPWPRLAVRCASCGELSSTSLCGLVHALPAVRAFWRAHPRMRILPPREIEAAGRAALVVRVESMADSAALDVLSHRDTYALLAVHGHGIAATATGDPA